MGAARRVGGPGGAGFEVEARRWPEAAAPDAAVACTGVVEDEPEEGLWPVGTLEVLGALGALAPRRVEPLEGFWL